MTSHYMPIPSDSDNEDDNMSVTVPDSGYDGGSERSRSRSPERFHFFLSQNVPEEDPEEVNTPTIDSRSPRPISPPPGPRVRTRATARKSVPIPIMHQWTRTQSPETIIPTTDPYAQPPGSSQGWERTLDTLRGWKNAGRFPSSVRGKGPIAARYEPILDPTPIIVDQMIIHENRLDLIEDGMMDMPGGDAFNELQERVYDVEGNTSHVNDTVQTMKTQLEANTKELRSMKHKMESMEHKMYDCHTMQMMAEAAMEGTIRTECKEGKNNFFKQPK